VKRLLFLCILCVLASSLVLAQEAGTPETPGKPNFFVLFWKGFWNGFVEGLITPQVHKPFSVMGGIEYTGNDRDQMLPEVFVASDYELSRYVGLGVRGGITFGSQRPEDSLVSVMEGLIYSRFYVWDFGFIRPFFQTGIGISLDREQEYEYTDVLGEFATGVRMHWKGWYIENAFRYGYPFRIAFGMSVGHSFLP
jgi:hypothetical protein